MTWYRVRLLLLAFMVLFADAEIAWTMDTATVLPLLVVGALQGFVARQLVADYGASRRRRG